MKKLSLLATGLLFVSILGFTLSTVFAEQVQVTWSPSPVTNMPGGPRGYGMGCLVLDNEIWLISGGTSSSPVERIEIYNPSNNSWKTADWPIGLVKRISCTASVVGDQIWLIGGGSSSGGYAPVQIIRKIRPGDPGYDPNYDLISIRLNYFLLPILLPPEVNSRQKS
jgi:hypothetical protein